MRTFEERFTAWVDGELNGDALAEFEKELAAQHENAASERDGAVKLGALLREHGVAPAMTNQDFFSSQLMDRIDAERPTEPAVAGEAEQGTWWGLPKMVWVGAGCLFASVLILPVIAPDTPDTVAEDLPAVFEDAYLAEVLESHTNDPGITATAIHSADNDMTVVWLEGLDFIPASNEITPSSRAN